MLRNAKGIGCDLSLAAHSCGACGIVKRLADVNYQAITTNRTRIEWLIGGSTGDVQTFGMGCRSCGSTMTMDSWSTSCRGAPPLSSYWLVETRAHKLRTLIRLCCWQTTLGTRPDEIHDLPVQRCPVSPNTGGDGGLP